MYGPPIYAPDTPFQYSHHPNISTPSRPYEFSHRQYSNYFDTAPPNSGSYSSYIPNIPQYPPYYSKWDRSYFSKPTLNRSYDSYWNRSLGYEVPRPYVPYASSMPSDRFSMNRPIYDRSIYDKPMYDRPIYDRSMYDRAMYDRPMYDRPIYDDRSIYERPIYERPMYERPMYESNAHGFEREPLYRSNLNELSRSRYEQPPPYLSSRFEEPGRGFERREYEEEVFHRERQFGKEFVKKKVFDDNHFEISRDHNKTKQKTKQNPTHKETTTMRKEFESPLSSTKRKI